MKVKYLYAMAALILMIAPAIASAQVDQDFGSATPSAGYCTCIADNGASHADSSFEWLGPTVDQETDCFDDNDMDGIIDIYTVQYDDNNCEDWPLVSEGLFGYNLGVVEVQICVSDYTSDRYNNGALFLTAWWDQNHDGDFDDLFTWADCPDYSPHVVGEAIPWLKAMPLEPYAGNCYTVNTYCFSPDISFWTDNCQTYRLTFRTPCGQPSGTDFWMRFRLGWGSCPSSACGPEDWGEVEDLAGTDPVLDDIGQTPVELVSFTAEGELGHVALEWVTAAEPDNAGFALWRSDSTTGEYARITSSLIPAEGDATHGASYGFVDNDVARGETYWYKLENIDIHGMSAFYGPVNAVVPESILCGAVSTSGGASLVLFALVMTAVIAVRRTIEKRRRPYRRPEVRTESGDRMLRKIGPAQTCSPTPAQCPTAD